MRAADKLTPLLLPHRSTMNKEGWHATRVLSFSHPRLGPLRAIGSERPAPGLVLVVQEAELRHGVGLGDPMSR
jgi:hypothetical protein